MSLRRVGLTLVICLFAGGCNAPAQADPWAVAAARQPLTASDSSPALHDTETNALVAHAGKLFAATDQWEYKGSPATGQVLVKRSKDSPWTVFENTESLRVQALKSFAVPADQGLGSGHSLLITQAVIKGRSEIQWLLDGAEAFTPDNSYALPSHRADVRAFGARESDGVWAVYAGVRPDGIVRGTWSPQRHTLVFAPTPELTVVPPEQREPTAGKVTGFADCGGALYASINTKLFRRNEGNLPPGVARWVQVYQGAPVGPRNSGLRGLTCITHDSTPSLLLSTEGTGNVYRFDHLPTGLLDSSVTLEPTLEFSPTTAIRPLLDKQGTRVPADGPGSIGYLIAAYNDGGFQSVDIGGVTQQLFGFEWSYRRSCPATRSCEQPPSSDRGHFDAAACFAIRTDSGGTAVFDLRCLAGPDLTPAASPTSPVRSGQAFVSIRTIQLSPFGDGLIYYGGYDCNFSPADGTAWVATSTVDALHIAKSP
ncbi:MAG TPA: hypothetical protein VLZ05_19220 [Mycobacterium sp.]|nr:hypothetical protein [Mycobacterium sp.]HUH70812.1 hypothetical protein [Mycobacterium sp.]